MASFLETTELQGNYTDSRTEARKYFDKFDEYDRLAANGIRPDLPSNYPRVNDGTMAAMLLEDAKRVFSSLYTGRFSTLNRNDAWFDELVNILWRRILVPNANTDFDFYTKFWNFMYRAEQHGAASGFVFLNTAREDYTGADWILDNIRDVYLESGKISSTSANYAWRNSYLTKLDLKRIIERAQAEDDKAKDEKRDSFNSWDVDVLKAYYDAGPTGKEEENKNRTEKEKQIQSQYYSFATCYHRGYNAPFYTIIPNLTGKLARTRYNENPTGATPIVFAYHTPDMNGPYGKGVIQIAGTTQNVLDYFTQGDVLVTQMGVEAPVKISGDTSAGTGFVRSSIVYGPRAQWEVGSANVSTVDLGNSVYDGLQNRMARYKTNLLNQMGSFDTSSSAEAGNPQFSKTSAGVKKLDSRENVNDNFFSMMGASAFKQLAETLMNVHLANMQGKEPFTLLDDEVQRLQRAGWALNGNKDITLVYNNMRGKLQFTVDDPASANDAEAESLGELIKGLSDSPDAIAQIEADGDYRVDMGEAWRQLLAKKNIRDLDKIIVPIDTDAHGNGQDATNTQTTTEATQGDDAAAQNASRPPSESINYKDVPPDVKAQMEAAAGFTPSATHSVAMQQAMQPPAAVPAQTTPAATAPAPAPAEVPQDPAELQRQHDETMQQYGVDENGAAMIMAARHLGHSEDDIKAYVEKARQNAMGGVQ